MAYLDYIHPKTQCHDCSVSWDPFLAWVKWRLIPCNLCQLVGGEPVSSCHSEHLAIYLLSHPGPSIEASCLPYVFFTFFSQSCSFSQVMPRTSGACHYCEGLPVLPPHRSILHLLYVATFRTLQLIMLFHVHGVFLPSLYMAIITVNLVINL